MADFIHWFDTIDSTNTRLLADKGSLPDRTVYAALFQTAGRGQKGNRWESRSGENLTFSILLKPEALPAREQFILSQIVALGLLDFLRAEGVQATIKWPNDIYVGDRKICGILIENRLQGGVIKDCIIGVGLNVNQQRFVSDAPNPVSLANLTGRLHDREVLLQRLLEAFDEECAGLEGVRLRYLPRLYRREKFHRYRDAQGEFFARIATVEEDGRLTLETIDGHTNRYAFKEVQFVL